MMLLSFWSKSPFKYGLSMALIVLYLGAVWVAFHPQVSPEYQAYYIDQTGHCFHNRPPATLGYLGKIRFGSNRPAQSCTTLIHGWSWQEPWGTWSDGPLSEIIFTLDSDAHQKADLRFHFIGFAPLGNQNAWLYINDKFYKEWALPHEAQTTIHVAVPISKPSEDIRLQLYFSNPLALEWFGKTSNPTDRRHISMGLLGFEWTPPRPDFATHEVPN